MSGLPRRSALLAEISTVRLRHPYNSVDILMRTFAATVDIMASPARVWAVLSEIERWPEWTPSVSKIQRVDDGPMRVGSKARVKQPKIAAGVFEVTSWDPDCGFEWVSKQPGVKGVARHTIEPAGAGSRVTLSVEFSGPLSLMVVWLYGGLTERYVRMEAEGLRRRAEMS